MEGVCEEIVLNSSASDPANVKSTFSKWVKYLNACPKGPSRDDPYNWSQDMLAHVRLAQQMGYSNCVPLVSMLESTLVALLGHSSEYFRERAVVFLNVLYDGHDMQLDEPLSVTIACVGEAVTIRFPFIDHHDQPAILDQIIRQNWVSSLVIHMKCSGENPGESPIWKQFPLDQTRDFVQAGKSKRISYKFSEFKRPGFYDWKLETSDQQPIHYIDQRRLQGRFVVHPQNMRHSLVYEFYVDQVGATWNNDTGNLEKRGSFDTVLAKLPEIKSSGASAVYIMGALERPANDPDASPFNIADRQSVSQRLGGEASFSHLISEIRRLGMVPIVDGVDRISRWASRKYRGMHVETLDSRKLRVPHAGTDGVETQWNDSILLNYRKIQAWDYYIQEIKTFARYFGVRGVRLDNAQSAPVIMEPNIDELLRIDPDNVPHYPVSDIFFGSVVRQNMESGYWRTSAALDLHYPNPFLVKVCRELWNEFSDFIILGESYFQRENLLAISGIIPHSLNMAQILASISGNSLRKDGSLIRIPANKRSNPSTMGRFLKAEKNTLPKKAIVLRSTCSHTSPYPAALYGRRAWVAVDLMVMLPGIPLLMFGEESGETYRINMAEVIHFEQQQDATLDINFNKMLPRSPPKRPLANPGSSYQDLTDLLNKTSSLQKKVPSLLNLANASPSLKSSSPKNSPMRDRSELDLKKAGIRSVDKHELVRVSSMNKQIRQELGPSEGFDLARIREHYNHRLSARESHEVFRTGNFCGLTPDPQFKHQIFAFARYTETEIAIVVMNLQDGRDGPQYGHEVFAHINLGNLLNNLPDYFTDNVYKLIHLREAFSGQYLDENLYTLEELLFRKLSLRIKPLQTLAVFLDEVPYSEENKSIHMSQCIKRLQTEVDTLYDPRENALLSRLTKAASLSYTEFYEAVEAIIEGLKSMGNSRESIEYIFKRVVQRSSSMLYNVLYEGLMVPKDFEPPSGERILAYLSHMSTACPKQDYYLAARSVLKQVRRLGPLVFVAPEIGRFSTAGGLGVMVDELTKCLFAFGLEVYVISPYYTVNRKNETGYLGPGFSHTRNIRVNLGNEILECGLFEGVEGGVNYIFIERGDYFPKVYADPGGAERHLKTVMLMSMGALEACCQNGLKPGIVITNDWLPAMAAGYAKQGFYGDFFNDTKFFHLIHNLGAGAYEGRLYPNKQQGTLDHIHQLPSDLLVDFSWSSIIVNPSRCAILCSDSWGTVSPSYLNELRGSHPLQNILQIAKQPFGYPNGIRQEERERLLREKAGNSHIEVKRKLQQKYFGYVDDSRPLFAFVGRITSQKGVHLILNAVDELVSYTKGQIHIMICGPAQMSDDYSGGCARNCYDLRRRHGQCFWADPESFFTDGPVVNLGADFGVMPSIFEPGGIVQQEFFVAGTPVIAFKTGGLRDTVHEWNSELCEGNGFTFEGYTHHDFVHAMKRALRVYSSAEEYNELRQSAYETTIDVTQVAWAWSNEFHRMRNAIYSQAKEIHKEIERAANEESKYFTERSMAVKVQWSGSGSMVFIKGSFDDWNQDWALLKDDDENSKYSVTLRLAPGEYLFKFNVDGSWVVADDQAKKESGGFVNNVLKVG